MAFPNQQPTDVHCDQPDADPYFLITITNFPHFLQRTLQYQQPLNQHGNQQQNVNAILIPNKSIHVGAVHTDAHETLMYNTLRFELREAVRAYLQRTTRERPVHFVFDILLLLPFLTSRANASMEFSFDALNQIIMNMPSDQSSDLQNSSSTSSTSEHTEYHSLQEQEPTAEAKSSKDRQYCLIIFNNPSWSRRLTKKPVQAEPTIVNQHQTAADGNKKPSQSIDDLFVERLRKLLDDYMQHTKRPFPIKYFLDFTAH